MWGCRGINGGRGSVGALWVRVQGGKWGCREAMGCIGGGQRHWRDTGVHSGVGVRGRTAMGGAQEGVGPCWGCLCNLEPGGCAGLWHPKNCCCHLCVSPCPGTLSYGSPPSPGQGAPGPSSATLSRSPGDSQTPFQGLCAVLGSERVVSDKGGSGGGVGAAVPSRPVQRQNKPKACPWPCPCPCPSRVRAHVRVLIHAHAPPRAAVAPGNAPGVPPSPSRAGSPWAPQPHSGSVPSRLSPGVPPVPPLAAGIGAMAFKLEERWRWQFVLGATSCRL